MERQRKEIKRREELQERLNKILNSVLPYPKHLNELEELVEEFEERYEEVE